MSKVINPRVHIKIRGKEYPKTISEGGMKNEKNHSYREY